MLPSLLILKMSLCVPRQSPAAKFIDRKKGLPRLIFVTGLADHNMASLIYTPVSIQGSIPGIILVHVSSFILVPIICYIQDSLPDSHDISVSDIPIPITLTKI